MKVTTICQEKCCEVTVCYKLSNSISEHDINDKTRTEAKGRIIALASNPTCAERCLRLIGHGYPALQDSNGPTGTHLIVTGTVGTCFNWAKPFLSTEAIPPDRWSPFRPAF